MAAAVIFMQWESYVGDVNGPPFFSQDPIMFNSRQERLHRLAPGDRLWLVSRCPDDAQYCFIAALRITELRSNPAESEVATRFGEFAIVADRSKSQDIGTRFPAEGLLRAFTFETGRPIKYGASIGQSLQTLRFLEPGDECVLNACFEAVVSARGAAHSKPCGLWTKCDNVFANYFLNNWRQRREPLAFMLYDPPPALPTGSPVFIHSSKSLRLLARFRLGQFVAGHKQTVETDERIAERQRVWKSYRADTIEPPAKPDFDQFWEGQNGVRGLFVMDEVAELPQPVAFKVYGRALEWGFPMGVGYRYLSLPQSVLLLRLAETPSELRDSYLHAMLDGARPRVDS